MHEHNLLRRYLLHVCHDRFPRGVRAKLEVLHLAAQLGRRLVGIERHRIARLRGAQDARRGSGIGIADKENRMLRLAQNPARKNIRKRFRRHHSAGERVDAAGLGRRIRDGLAIQDERLHRFQQLQPWKIPPAVEREAIVNLRHLQAQTADVDRKIAEQFLAPKAMDHGQRLLCLAQREDRHENATPIRKSPPDRLRQPLLLRRARETLGQGVIAAGAFHDQDVDPALREHRALRDRLIVEIHITTVKKSAPLRAQQHARRSEHVSRVDELERHAFPRAISDALPA